MKKIIFFVMVIASLRSHARSITITLSGDARITSTAYVINGGTSTSFSPALTGDDLLYISGATACSSINFRSLIFDTLHPLRIIWLPGAVVYSPRPNSFQQIFDYDVVGVSIEGMLHFNWYGTSFKSYNMHNDAWLRCQWYWPPGSNQDQVPELWDDKNNLGGNSMIFAGTKDKTFYRNSYTDCKFDGTFNASFVIMGSDWGNTGSEINRSIQLDALFIRDTFQNINQSPHINISAISGTGPNLRVLHCEFNNIAGDTSGHDAHNGTITWYGNATIMYNHQWHCYAQLYRGYSIAWNGLPGYRTGAKLVFAANIVEREYGYSGAEFGMNDVGNRDNAHGWYQCQNLCLYNTIYRTNRRLTGGLYYAGVCDVVNVDSITCRFNLIVLPEADQAYDSAGRGYLTGGYFVMVPSGNPTYSVINSNKCVATWSTAILLDTLSFRPGPLALLPTPGDLYSFLGTDFYGTGIPGTGPLYYGAVSALPTVPTGGRRILRGRIRIKVS
jgi:hypothetical protein